MIEECFFRFDVRSGRKTAGNGEKASRFFVFFCGGGGTPSRLNFVILSHYIIAYIFIRVQLYILYMLYMFFFAFVIKIRKGCIAGNLYRDKTK